MSENKMRIVGHRKKNYQDGEKNWCSEEFNILYFSVKSVIMTNECGLW